MAMVVKNNMSAVNTLNTLNKNQSALGKSLAKVSSGMKINSAQDDASGYAISERMRVMIRSLDQANQNTQNGSSLMKVAEGAVSSTVEILKTLKEKAINAATDTNTDEDRAIIQKEIDQLVDQIDDNALVSFNGKYLLDGSKALSGSATKTAFTNQLLSKSTQGLTMLTDLKNRKDETLGIIDTDWVTASYVKDGKTYTTKYQVGTSTVEDIFYSLNELNDTQVFGAANTKDITMTVTDAKTNIKFDDDTINSLVDNLQAGATSDKLADAANVLLAQGLAGNTENDHVDAVGDAFNKLRQDIYNQLGATTLQITAGYNGSGNDISGQFTLTLDKVYNADGSVGSSRTYTFTTGSVSRSSDQAGGDATRTVRLSDEINSEELNALVDDVMASVKNMVNAATEVNTSQAKTDVNSDGIVDAIRNAMKMTGKTVVLNSSTASEGDYDVFTVSKGLDPAAEMVNYDNGGNAVSSQYSDTVKALGDAMVQLAAANYDDAALANAVTTDGTDGKVNDVVKSGTLYDKAKALDAAFTTINDGDGWGTDKSQVAIIAAINDLYALDSKNELVLAAKKATTQDGTVTGTALTLAVLADPQTVADTTAKGSAEQRSALRDAVVNLLKNYEPYKYGAEFDVNIDGTTADTTHTYYAKTNRDAGASAIYNAIDAANSNANAWKDSDANAALEAAYTKLAKSAMGREYTSFFSVPTTASKGSDGATAQTATSVAYSTSTIASQIREIDSDSLVTIETSLLLELDNDGAQDSYLTAGKVNGVANKYVNNFAANYALAFLTSKTGGALVNASANIGLGPTKSMITTADGTVGLTVTASQEGLAGQISGITVSISDSQGNVRKTVNEFLDAFSTSIFASNKSEEDTSLKIHVGAQANQSISVGLADMRAEALGLKGADGSVVSVATQSQANAAIAAFTNALQKALDQQTTIGAIEARLEYTSSNLTTSTENVQAAESTIRDADMAKEMTNYTKNNVLLQAAQSMLAQANQNSSAVLSLLQ